MTKGKDKASRGNSAVLTAPDPAHGSHREPKHHTHGQRPINPDNLKKDHRPFKGVRKEGAPHLTRNNGT